MLNKCHDVTYKETLDFEKNKKNLLIVPGNTNFFRKAKHEHFVSSLRWLSSKNANKNFKDVVGSSTCAPVALLLSLGYKTKEIQIKLDTTSFRQIVNNIGNKHKQPLSIVIDNGISKDKNSSRKPQFKISIKDSFLEWAKEQISDKLVHPLATFIDLKKSSLVNNSFKNIHLIGLNLETKKLEVFNYKNTPNIPIAIAVRICMSYSTVFSIVEIIDANTHKKSVYVDGGLVLQHIDFSNYKIA